MLPPPATDQPAPEQDRILFLCLARDCAPTLPGFFAYLRGLEGAGFRASAIVGENGSRDGTRQLLKEASSQGIDLLDTRAMSGETQRLARMAIGRQMLLDEAKRRETAAEVWICVVDLDNVMLEPPPPETMHAVLARLRADPTLFAVGASSRPFFYDLLSLRCEGHDYSHLDAEIAEAKRRPLSYHRFHQRRIYANQRLLTRSTAMRCESSFNGMCVYDGASYLRGTYLSPEMATMCEHVTLNLSISRATGRQMLIDPDLVLAAPADHKPVNFARFWYDRVRERIG